MGQQFILQTKTPEQGQLQAKDRKGAAKLVIAAKIVKVEGGWLAFETHTDYGVWAAQR